MGVCEGFNLDENTSSKNKSKILSNKSENPSPFITGKNYFNAPIPGNSNILNSNNMSQSTLYLGNTLTGNPFQKPKKMVYNQNSFQTSYINGSSIGMFGNSINKGSKAMHDSMSNSCGEIIIDGQINPEIKGDKNIEKFFGENDNIIDKEFEDENKDEKNKKDVNLYHRINKNNNGNKQKNLLID